MHPVRMLQRPLQSLLQAEPSTPASGFSGWRFRLQAGLQLTTLFLASTAPAQSPAPATAPAPPAAAAEAAPPVPEAKWSAAAKEALAAFNKGDGKQALSLAIKGAASGDPDSLMFLGRMYEQGIGTTADPVKAFQNYQAASDKGQLEARAHLARCLETGTGTKANPEKADFLWQQAAEQGFPMAQGRMGVLEMDGIRRPKNETAAREWFEKAATGNDGVALFRLAQFYLTGLGGAPKDPAKAVETLLKSANTGNMDAVNQVGICYQTGYGLRQDKVAAAGWFNFAAEYRHPAAMSNLGQCYETGQGVKLNLQIAARLYTDAASLGDAVGHVCLGNLLRDGRGMEKDPVKAYVHYQQAVALGLTGAEKLRNEAKTALSPKQLAEAEKVLRAPGTSSSRK